MYFLCQTPSIQGFSPTRGPQSGGTNLTITGKNLGIGSTRQVSVSDHNTCQVVSVNSTTLHCLTGPWSSSIRQKRQSVADRALNKSPVTVKIDDETLITQKSFFYMPDPVVKSISPRKSILSGGILITIKGDNLDASDVPLLTGSFHDKQLLPTKCVVNDTGNEMVCPSMKLVDVKETDVQVTLALVYDNRNINIPSVMSPIVYKADPVFPKFPVNEFIVSEQFIYFQGYHILNANKLDYKVTIGKKDCAIMELEETRLKCQPDLQGINVGDGTRYDVEITVGNLEYKDLGYVEFVEAAAAAGLSIGIIILIIIFGLVIISVIVLLVLMKRQRCGFFKVKTGSSHSIRYSQEEAQNFIGPQAPHTYNINNEYSDGGLHASSSQPHAHIDDETMQLIKSENLLVDRECLVLADEIGKGNFGCVKRGFLTLPDQKGDILVAVKTLHNDNPRDIELQSFLQEALRMKDFNHPNVLALIGVCLDLDTMPLVVLPFMKHGDLLTYIRDEQNVSVH
ncbi:hypothetical protein Btru_071123 [Bulinus truncatus]|nr:hypothetical protein Btru_071123 [Bulinus truncatus]